MEVEYIDYFGEWWDQLTIPEQESVAAVVNLLQEHGVKLRFPRSSGVSGSRFAHMRELRIQPEGRPYRVLYAFDPHRAAILLLGGAKTGDDRWYETNVPIADRLYEQHLKGGSGNGEEI